MAGKHWMVLGLMEHLLTVFTAERDSEPSLGTVLG